MGGLGGDMLTNVFITPDQVHGDRLVLCGADVAHLTKVLRLGIGDRFAALDGTGGEYLACITAMSQTAIEAVIEHRGRRQTEPAMRITLGQALPKGDKMDLVIRQGTEVGVAAFQPLLTERCVAVPGSGRMDTRIERWRRIAMEAAKQSGRAVVPPVAQPLTWPEILASLGGYDLVVLPWETETEAPLKEVLQKKAPPHTVLIMIGPEGGFSRSEAAAAQQAGAAAVTLGPRILRTETAGLVTAAALLYHYDEFSMHDHSHREDH